MTPPKDPSNPIFQVDYLQHPVSDEHLREVLSRVAQALQTNLEVTSGDRDQALAVGGGIRSLHLKHRAADFHQPPLTDGAVFQRIQDLASSIFASSEAYELIHHGPFTETTGPHVHLGHYPQDAHPPGVYCKIEGLTAADRGKYTVIRVVHVDAAGQAS